MDFHLKIDKDRSEKHTISTYHKLLPQKMTLAYLNKLQLPEDENIYHPTNQSQQQNKRHHTFFSYLIGAAQKMTLAYLNKLQPPVDENINHRTNLTL